MSYADLFLSVPIGGANEALFKVAVELAARFDAGVIGVAACRPVHVVCRDYLVPAGIFDEDRKQIERGLAAAEAAFRRALQGKVKHLAWRSFNDRRLGEPPCRRGAKR